MEFVSRIFFCFEAMRSASQRMLLIFTDRILLVRYTIRTRLWLRNGQKPKELPRFCALVGNINASKHVKKMDA